jgi:hypothetical protein
MEHAGQMLVIAISVFPSLSQSIAKPLVRMLIPTFPIAYAVLPRKKREYIGGLTTIIRPFQPLALKYGKEDCTEAYKPSALTDCMSWYRFVGVFSTDAHQIAPGL